MPIKPLNNKTCTACKKTLRLTSFAKTKSLDLYPSGYFSECKPCRQAAAKAKKAFDSLSPEEQAAQTFESKRKLQHKASIQQARAQMAKEKRALIQEASDPAKELAARTLARRRLLAYIKKFMPNYQDGWVHRDICQRLEKFLQDVADQKSPRLMLCMPPRHGKSEIASKQFPSWALGKYPFMEIIACSYAVSLPLGFSRKVRDRLMGDKNFQTLFPEAKVSSSAQSSEGWETTEGGGYVPAGVGGSITGKGAHILIIDDPVKDAAEADSATIRASTWDWWGATAKTRLAPGGGVLVIQTRWHDDDLGGRMLKQMTDAQKEFLHEEKDALARMKLAKTRQQKEDIEAEITQLKEEIQDIDTWELINYPAIATHDEFLTHDKRIVELDEPNAIALRKKGDALHPARFPLPRLRNMRRTMQPRHWSALYQQNPVPDEGSYFTRDMFRYRRALPGYEGTLNYMAVDLAIGEKQVNDKTVITIGAHHWDNTLTIPEMIGGRWGTYEICDNICKKIVQWDIQICGIENGSLKLAIWPVLSSMMKKRNITCVFDETLTPITDKSVRARPLQGMMQGGMIYFVDDQEWLETAKHEMLRFPGGVHDDYVDSLAWLIRVVLKQQAPERKVQEAATNYFTQHGSWKDKLENYVESDGYDYMSA